MRKVVCQMMMTLNGRVDDPMAWMSELSNEQYEFIDQAYAQFDTVLVGRVTYDEMFASWPKARADKDASKAHKSMAERMHRYRKIVITTKNFSPQWNNSEAAICKGDHDVQSLVARLKNADGAGIHLSGGARLAQTLARLDLVDEYNLMVNPTISVGNELFAKVGAQASLRAQEPIQFPGGVIAMRYTRERQDGEKRKLGSFDELIKRD